MYQLSQKCHYLHRSTSKLHHYLFWYVSMTGKPFARWIGSEFSHCAWLWYSGNSIQANLHNHSTIIQFHKFTFPFLLFPLNRLYPPIELSGPLHNNLNFLHTNTLFQKLVPLIFQIPFYFTVIRRLNQHKELPDNLLRSHAAL